MGEKVRAWTVRGLLIGVLLTVSLIPLPEASGTTNAVPIPQAERLSILIEGDSGFTPENGVIAGAGTPGDPYVIAGWEIFLRGPPGVEIRNTSAFFVVRDVVMVGTIEGAFDAVVLRNLTNARVENVTSEANRIGVLLDSVRSSTVTGNSLAARQPIRVVSSTDVTVAQNVASGGPGGSGLVTNILVVDSSRVDIDSNHLNTGYGISIGADRSSDLRIENNTVQGYGDGIILDSVNDTSVVSNDLTQLPDVGFSSRGFVIRSSSRISLTGNWFREFDEDWIERSANVTLEGNRLPGYLYDLLLSSSRDIVLTNNSMDRGGLRIAGADLRDYDTHSIDTTNTIAGRPVAYLHDCIDTDFNGAAVAQVIAVNCRGIRVANASFSHVTVGVHALLSTDVTVENSLADGTFEGVLVEASTDVTVVNVTMSGGAFGIHVAGSTRFSIRDNRVRNIPQDIFLEASTDGQVIRNLLTESTNVALGVEWSQRVLVSRNNVTGNHWGIDVYSSTDVVLEGNTVALNDQGIVMDASEGVRVYHNEFLGNGVQARDYSGGTNQWDDGYPSGGNSWSDYRGWDDCGGAAQDLCPGSDGLGDIPYDLGEGVKDHYPIVPVNPPNQPPSASFSYAPPSLAPGIPVTFDARSSSDPDGWPLRYAWDFGDGTQVSGTSPTVEHTYQGSQTFTVTLMVTDPRGGTATATGAVMVGYRPVTSFTFSPSHPKEGEPVAFDGSASYDPDGTINTFEWSLGDGSGYSPNGGSFSYVYALAGSFVVQLTVTDDAGFRSSVTQTIEVASSPIVLVPFSHPAGFRLSIPQGWTVQQDIVIRGLTIELVALGPAYAVQTNLIVDTDVNASVRESASFLFDSLNASVEQARFQTGERVEIVGSPALRTIGGHAGITFMLQFGTTGLLQTGAIVVSEAHGRSWVLVLTTDVVSFPRMNEAFGRILDSFEITAAIPLALVMAAAGGILAAVIGLVVLLVRSRSKRPVPPVLPTTLQGGIPPPTGEAGPVSRATTRFCSRCGAPADALIRFCPRCGQPM